LTDRSSPCILYTEHNVPHERGYHVHAAKHIDRSNVDVHVEANKKIEEEVDVMSHIFQLSDEQYAKLAAYAAQYEQTPEILFQTWVDDLIHALDEQTLSMSIEQADQEEQEEQEVDPEDHPLLRIAGMFAIGEPGWADRHDEYLAEVYADNHAEEK
jgi:hypothetical protein